MLAAAYDRYKCFQFWCMRLYQLSFLKNEVNDWNTVNYAKLTVLNAIRYFVPYSLHYQHMLLHHRVPHGPLTKYVKLRVRMRRECRERYPRQRG